jgi:multimeric flavodoxin WrbA
MSKVLVITTSLRTGSNSDRLSEELIRGAKDAGHEVGHISLKGKEIKYCIGCLACQKTQKCVLKDDAIEIAEKVKEADTLVFVTPVCYYEMILASDMGRHVKGQVIQVCNGAFL